MESVGEQDGESDRDVEIVEYDRDCDADGIDNANGDDDAESHWPTNGNTLRDANADADVECE